MLLLTGAGLFQYQELSMMGPRFNMVSNGCSDRSSYCELGSIDDGSFSIPYSCSPNPFVIDVLHSVERQNFLMIENKRLVGRAGWSRGRTICRGGRKGVACSSRELRADEIQ